MSRKNRNTLADRVIKAAEAALATQDYVSPIDVLVGIGWLDPGSVERWRRGQIDCLERVVQTNLPRISEAMKLFRSWATGRGLFASPTHYVTRTPRRQTLRFSRSGDPTIEGRTADQGLSAPKLGCFPTLGIQGGPFGSQPDVGTREPAMGRLRRWFTDVGMTGFGGLC